MANEPHSPCRYPGCKGTAKNLHLCDEHSSKWGGIPRRNRDANLLPNDGIYDHIAVDAAVRGLRTPGTLRLTWVEREAAYYILCLRGLTPLEITERLGFSIAKWRWLKVRRIAQEAM